MSKLTAILVSASLMSLPLHAMISENDCNTDSQTSKNPPSHSISLNIDNQTFNNAGEELLKLGKEMIKTSNACGNEYGHYSHCDENLWAKGVEILKCAKNLGSVEAGLELGLVHATKINLLHPIRRPDETHRNKSLGILLEVFKQNSMESLSKFSNFVEALELFKSQVSAIIQPQLSEIIEKALTEGKLEEQFGEFLNKNSKDQ